MAAVAPTLTSQEDEFLNSWFPDLDTRPYIIPVIHVGHIQAEAVNIGDIPASVLTPADRCTVPTAQEIKVYDEAHRTLHALLTRLKNHLGRTDVMVIMTQARFSMYQNIATAAFATTSQIRNVVQSPLDIVQQKQNHSDLVIVNKHRGILLGVEKTIYVADLNLARKKLEESVYYLAEAARIVENVVRTVPGADNIPVHKTLVLPNITRTQLDRQLQNAVHSVPCLCKDEMDTEKSLENWWHSCWSPECQAIESDVYRQLVARFAIPATRVQIYLTTQPRLQLKHESEVVNAVGDVQGAEVFQAGLHQLSLFPTQAELLDFDALDETSDDVKFLWGPPGTGKTILLELRAMQWVKHFHARHIFILQTRRDGTAASCLLECQLQQTLEALRERSRESGEDARTVQCTFSHVDMSRLLSWVRNRTTDRWVVVMKEGWKEEFRTSLAAVQCHQPDASVHVVADEANGDVVAAVYQWLKEEGVETVRLWAAGVEAFQDTSNIPASLRPVVCHVTEPLRCPGPVVEEVMRAGQIEGGRVPRYDESKQVTAGLPVVTLYHRTRGRNGHMQDYSWRCAHCAQDLVARFKSLRVGEADEGRQGLSANDVFILGRFSDCDYPDDSFWSPVPLINVLEDNGYNVRMLTVTSSRDEITAVARRDNPPSITVANERCVWGLERKIVVYCESGGGGGADESGRIAAFSRATSLLIYVILDLSP